MFMEKENTAGLWAIELDMAKRLLAVCRKHNLRIWADYGTLLGAVRHQGFIPWDDDMDFVMPRNDFDKLLEIGPKEFDEPYFFQSVHTDNFWDSMAKIRKSGTAMIEDRSYIERPRHNGIYIDIFALDAVPDDNDIFLAERKKVLKLKCEIRKFKIKKISVHSFKSLIGKMLIRTDFYRIVYHRLHKTLSKNKLGESKRCAAFHFLSKEESSLHLRQWSWYDDTIFLPFEDILVPAPKCFDEVLTCYYGDYMVPVKGASCHRIVKFDCCTDYKELMNA